MGKAESDSKKSTAKKTSATKGEAKAEEPAKNTAVKKTATKTASAEPSKREATKTSKAAKPEKPDQKQTVSASRAEPESVEVAPASLPETKPAAVEAAAPESRATAELDNSVLPANRGKVAIFGGPKDRSIKPDDKVALPIGRHFTYDRVRSLDSRGYYCAMRWNYRFSHMTPEEAKRWWANKKLLVTNTANGKSVIVRAVDYGPHEKTGLDIGLSPGAAAALEVGIGDEVEILFADQKSPLGSVGNE